MVSLFCPLPQTTGPLLEGPSERRAGDGEGACGFALDHTVAFPPHQDPLGMSRTLPRPPGLWDNFEVHGLDNRRCT